MNKEEFIIELKKLNIEVTDKKLKQLDDYYNFLIQENQKYNLTSITEEPFVYLKHFYDSLTITKSINLTNQYICDIGTGAGFPGIVLKIFFPEITIDLVDSTNKKCEFLNKVIKKLELQKIKTINIRAEDYSKNNKEIYDIVVSRAVAPLKHLLEYATPLLKINGYFIALKSNLDKELENIDNYHKKLSLSEENIHTFYLPKENSLRTIYKIKKISKTNPIYPRSYSQIKKKDI